MLSSCCRSSPDRARRHLPRARRPLDGRATRCLLSGGSASGRRSRWRSSSRQQSLLAYAIPPAASVSVAIHALHLLSGGDSGGPARRHVRGELIETAGNNAAAALDHVHHALAPMVPLTATPPTTGCPPSTTSPSSSSDQPASTPSRQTLVGAAQDAISWLARAVGELDQDSPETPSSLTEALARLLGGYVCATGGRLHGPNEPSAYRRHATRITRGSVG